MRGTYKDNKKTKTKSQEELVNGLNNYFKTNFIEDDIPIGEPPMKHNFDMVSPDGKIVIEFVAISWKDIFISLDVKIAAINEAIFYLSFLPQEVRKILLIKQRIVSKDKETFGEYYCKNNSHVLRDIEVWEVNNKLEVKALVERKETPKDQEVHEPLKPGKILDIIEPVKVGDINILSEILESTKDIKLTKVFRNAYSINYLWNQGNELEWNNAIDNYWNLLRKENIHLEKEFDGLDAMDIEVMSTEEFYDFLYNKYFVWKFTAKNRLATTRSCLEKYKSENHMDELMKIQEELFSFDKNDVRRGFFISTRIRGLGIAGGSGLLSILFPRYFGTIDQFVVKSLCKVEGLKEHEILAKMKPDSLRDKDGTVLEQILRSKSNELNERFKTDKWSPRMIDKVLWSIER